MKCTVLRVDTGLDGVVFRRETERVESHRMEHVIALHALHAGPGVGQRVVVPVTEVKICRRRVGEHLENV